MPSGLSPLYGLCVATTIQVKSPSERMLKVCVRRLSVKLGHVRTSKVRPHSGLIKR